MGCLTSAQDVQPQLISKTAAAIQQVFDEEHGYMNSALIFCAIATIALVGGPSSFCGHGNSSDYVVVSQAKKPQINVWQWGKPQVSKVITQVTST